MSYKGVDVSEFQGSINWDNLKPFIDFAIIRGGYGYDTLDAKAHRNLSECKRLGIPYGIYWFSYALSTSDAVREAHSLCDLADKYEPTYPLCFDFEYDSDRYAIQNGVYHTYSSREAIAKAFLSTVESRGYYAMIYTNPDYMSKGFGGLTDRYDLWLAEWDVRNPRCSCGIWQYGSDSFGNYSGLDANISYNDYPSIIAGMSPSPSPTPSPTPSPSPSPTPSTNYRERILKYFNDEQYDNYYNKALEVIQGKYGIGDERKRLIRGQGYDYEVVQELVNYIMGY